ncbi:MAG TPA: hypothetical protein VG052_08655 [Puia sp.]|jgi:hypothetical protein|nr:hypothetical protein [Puia sp.]
MKLIIIYSVILLTSIGKATSQQFAGEQEDFLKLSVKDSILLRDTWNSFIDDIVGKNYSGIKKMSLEKVYCNAVGNVLPGLVREEVMTMDMFIDSIIPKFYNGHFITVLKDSVMHMSESRYPHMKPSNFELGQNDGLILFEVYFRDHVVVHGEKCLDYYMFQFVKTAGKFEFFGMRLESPY